jgi:hypothetical protein
MHPFRRRPEAPPAASGQIADHASKLSQIRPIRHDDGERQNIEDRSTYHSPLQSIFEPVPYPNWLKPRRSKRRL